MEVKDLTANSDGSFSASVDGKSIRLVKESDLLAVKGASEQDKKAHESQTSKLMTELAEANRLRDDEHNKVLQEQAAKEQLVKEAKEAAILKAKVGEFESKLNTEISGHNATKESLLGLMKDRFVNIYRVAPDKVKGMSLEQLRDAEKVLALAGVRGTVSANYDGGAGGGSGSGAKTDAQRLAERYPTMKVS